jgi:inorganic pyrophosphatase
MKSLFHRMPLVAKEGVYHAIVEIPKGSSVKYEFNEDQDCIMVDRFFKTPVSYIQNYGFFPQSWNKYDKDPMDVIVISDVSIASGVVVPVRIVGIIEMDDTGELDHKILAVAEKDHAMSHVKDINDLQSEIVPNLEWFLTHYKDLEKGKEVKILGIKDAATALKFLDECAAEYQAHHAG